MSLGEDDWIDLKNDCTNDKIYMLTPDKIKVTVITWLQNFPNIFTYVITNKLWNCTTAKDIFHISWQTNVGFELITHFTKCIRNAQDINNLMGRVRDFAWGFKLFTISEVLVVFSVSWKISNLQLSTFISPKNVCAYVRSLRDVSLLFKFSLYFLILCGVFN